MTAFVFATGNPDKAREVCEIFATASGAAMSSAPIRASDETVIGFAIASLDSMDGFVAAIRRPAVAPDVAETGATLVENARIKARGVALALGAAAVADDTGLEIDALGGEPGVLSARYAGDAASYADNCAKVLNAMAEKRRASRTARFVTIALWFDPATGAERVERGVAEGVILDECRGEAGFGYDPVFAPAGGAGLTFAQMTASQKHAISHRGRAFRALAATFDERP
jgi:XTP/dITP diphosphohydrolase